MSHEMRNAFRKINIFTQHTNKLNFIYNSSVAFFAFNARTEPGDLTFLNRSRLTFVFIKNFSTDYKAHAFQKQAQSILNISRFLASVFMMSFWSKTRVIYYVNNWVYTTNHKRIAVNYFWFVILSGIVGMVLATIIRLEFAYPGVGVFAGDSIQYLTLASAHGVIMVFFMIMPLLFGAFANFLLPTQLGVHDVAFPRLNSAAFWFLPGGLLMLCQLVCVDRRYQRMNCFNIREIQSILKRKFFTDLINTHDQHTLLNKSAIGLRFKTNSINSTGSNMFIFYNYGIDFTSKVRNTLYGAPLQLWSSPAAPFPNNGISFVFNRLFLRLNDIFRLLFPTAHAIFTENFTVFMRWVISFDAEFFHRYFQTHYHLTGPHHWMAPSYGGFFTFVEIWCALRDIFALLYCTFSDIASFFTCIIYKFFFFIKDAFLSVLPLEAFNWTGLNTIKLSFSDFSFTKPFALYPFYDAAQTAVISSSSGRYFIHAYLVLYSTFELISDFLKLILSFFTYRFYENLINDFYALYVAWYMPALLNDNFFLEATEGSAKTARVYHSLNVKNKIDSEVNVSSRNEGALTRFFINLKDFFAPLFNLVTEYLYEFFSKFFFYASLVVSNVIQALFGTVTVVLFDIKTFFTFELFYNIFFIGAYDQFFNNLFKSNSALDIDFSSTRFKSKFFADSDLSNSFKYANEEFSEVSRYQRFSNPVFKYDYKSGDYFPKLYKEVYSFLFSTILNLTSGLKTAPWFFSNSHLETFNNSFLNYCSSVSKAFNFGDFSLHSWNSNKFTSADGFYNFFYLLSESTDYSNKKWVSVTSLNQKFYRMFNTSSMQQRVYSNWRQLKFTREAWRCKLLSARHQKTLFRRYLNEDGVFWSIERNAKDLIPGWAMITPFSSRIRFTAVGKTDIGLLGVLLVLNSSIISAANFLVTYRYLSTLNNRKMRDARSFFTEAVMVASWMMILANPMLVIGIVMLLSDRHWQTSFFDYSGGGDTVLFQHMFWFFGHPEVYIIILPTFGFTNTMLSYYLRKRVSARASLLYSMYTIAFLGFFVWGHHMYMVGLSHTTRMLFSTLTVMISVPAATKIMHWCVTTVNSSFAMELPLLFTFTFIFFFVSGGISGMCVAHTGMDILFHDTFYVIGHFHVMLAGGAMFASFGAFYFYFPAIFGVKFSRIYAYLHYTYYLIGQLMTIIPMFWLGYAGMPRRVLDYPSSFGGWHSVISAGHMLNVAGLMAFFIMIFDSLRQARAATRNTFGINRYNTRLNFYIYEIAKLSYVQQKTLFLYKIAKPSSLKLNGHNYKNYEPYETVLLTYVFLKK